MVVVLWDGSLITHWRMRSHERYSFGTAFTILEVYDDGGYLVIEAILVPKEWRK